MLEAALTDQPDVRRIAANPVMLTGLCVVHWNEGQIPAGRARVYRAVLRWLLAARDRLRADELGLPEADANAFAWEALARLALVMMGADGGGKRSSFDLHDAARAVETAVTRYFPALTYAGRRRQRAKQWLRFECLGSGVVEEVGQGRLRFWHLTFQEYLAARRLAWLDDGEAEPEESGEPEHWWPLVQGRLEAGYHRITWDGKDGFGRPVSSGVYLYRFVNKEWTQTKRMLLLK